MGNGWVCMFVNVYILLLLNMTFGALYVEVFRGMYTLLFFVQPSMDKPCNLIKIWATPPYHLLYVFLAEKYKVRVMPLSPHIFL